MAKRSKFSLFCTSYLCVIAFVVLTAGAVIASWRLQDTRNLSAQNEVVRIAEQASLRLGQFTTAHLYASEVLAQSIAAGDTDGEEEFAAFAQRLRTFYPGFQAVNWVDAEGVIRWISPTAGNEAALGRSVLQNPVAASALKSAESSLESRVSAPLTLFQGGVGFATYTPVTMPDGTIKGYVNSVFRTDDLIQTVFGEDPLAEFQMVIQDGEFAIFGAFPEEDYRAQQDWGTIQEIPLLNRRWNLHLAPRGMRWGERPRLLDPGTLVLGVGLAFLFALATWRLGQAQDDTRLALEQRSEMEVRLLLSQNMEAVGRLAGAVAHDFNNLLTTILGNAHLIDNAQQLNGDAKASLDEIRIAGERATQLTGKLLTISRKRVVQSKLIDFNKEIRTLDGVLRRLMRENIEFSETLESKSMVVDLDPSLLSQVIINLVVNAVDAMPTGGELHVSTAKLNAKLNGTHGTWVVLTVADTGSGMDEVTRSRALEPFFTTKKEGTGLGLATVEGIATGANGGIHIEENLPQGTRVSVWFPASNKAAQDKTTVLKSPFTHEGKALIVEDEPAVRHLGARLLQNLGFEVLEAKNGAEAINLVNNGLVFDLLFTDAVMPKVSGRALLEDLRARDLRFDAVVTSGYPDELQGADLTRLGAAFLAKPYTSELLRAAIQEAEKLNATAVASGA